MRRYFGFFVVASIVAILACQIATSASTGPSQAPGATVAESPVRTLYIYDLALNHAPTLSLLVAPDAATRPSDRARSMPLAAASLPPISLVAAAETGADRVVIGKMADITADGALGPGERTLLDQLPKLPTEEAQWAQNEQVLLQEMKSGNPIRDATVDSSGNPANNTGYLYWERATLIREGWTYDPSTTLWSPGG